LPTTTPSGTPTASPTASPTAPDTPTITPTPAFPPESQTFLLFPNPVKDGTPLRFYYNNVSAMNRVSVKIFTLAFRKIYEEDGLETAPGMNVYELDWMKKGLNPANGLYYVVLYQNGGGEERRVMKLLIQR
jgi:hypothetical protein